jgi:DNA-binding GntR family transcriptional regulator
MKPTRVATKARKTQTVKRGESVSSAVLKLRELIVEGQIAPGSWVVEAELTERLGFSRTPIRGALQLLQQEGFIIDPPAGANSRLRISPLTKLDAQELYLIVAQIESLAGTLTVALDDRALDALCERMTDLNDKLQGVADENLMHPGDVFELDSKFHREFVLAGAGARLRSLHQMVQPQIERYWRIYVHRIAQNIPYSVSEHREIISSIAKRNAKAIERAIHANWKNGADRICSLIDVLGERGSW